MGREKANEYNGCKNKKSFHDKKGLKNDVIKFLRKATRFVNDGLKEFSLF